MKTLPFLILAILVHSTFSDIYMHNPRGSNNRLNGNGQNTRNNNRLFDSQNNDKGGYLAGPPLSYYSKSLLQVEWTNQHGCGVGHGKVDCNLVLQYMCGKNVRDGARDEDNPALGNGDLIQRKNEDPDLRVDNDPTKFVYGQHETFDFYQTCKTRSRNKGLFAADQNLRNDIGATSTRQNPQGTQRGFECPEERDYYPYWHPTSWRDIAVLVTNPSRCDYYKSQSQNVKEKNYCGDPASNFVVNKNDWQLPPSDPEFSKHNNRIECENNGGKWYTYPSWGLDEPDCQPAEWARDNHLGNTPSGYSNAYMWVLPSISKADEPQFANCVLRLRYNISTSDYDAWGDDGPMVDSKSNGIASPVRNDPNVMFGGFNYTLAVNTAQFGRTFEDRSHQFSILSREGTGIDGNARIYNVNVRGKRGNIVQVYPAVEYDFVPDDLKIKVNDYVHFQWTGADNNPNGNDGEGRAGTDRSNIVQIKDNDGRNNYIYPLSQNDVKTSDIVPTQDMFSPSLAAEFAHVGQPNRFCTNDEDTNCCKTEEQLQKSNNRQQDPLNCGKLNAAPAYFGKAPVRFSSSGVYRYMSTRNNNFSNRSQKGTITVEPHLGPLAIAVVVLGSVAFVVGVVVAGGVLYSSSHPGSRVANIFQRV